MGGRRTQLIRALVALGLLVTMPRLGGAHTSIEVCWKIQDFADVVRVSLTGVLGGDLFSLRGRVTTPHYTLVHSGSLSVPPAGPIPQGMVIVGDGLSFNGEALVGASCTCDERLVCACNVRGAVGAFPGSDTTWIPVSCDRVTFD